MRFTILFPALALLASIGSGVHAASVEKSTAKRSTGKVGVLLVSHGSHSEQWRKMLMAIEDEVREDVLKCEAIGGIKSAFMEYTEPSIATRLKQFDKEGFTDVVIVPILLTVSSHSFDDIPVIAGQKVDRMTLDTLKLEGIEAPTQKTLEELRDPIGARIRLERKREALLDLLTRWRQELGVSIDRDALGEVRSWAELQAEAAAAATAPGA